MNEADFIAKCDAMLKHLQERRDLDNVLLPQIAEEHGYQWKKFGNEVMVTAIDNVAVVFEIETNGDGCWYPYPWPESASE